MEGVLGIDARIANDALQSEPERKGKEWDQRLPVFLIGKPEFVARQYSGKHDGQLLRFVGQPERNETEYIAALRIEKDGRERKSSAEEVEDVHRLPEDVE